MSVERDIPVRAWTDHDYTDVNVGHIEIRDVNIEAYVGEDGALVVQVDTSEPAAETEYETIRIWLNDSLAVGWRGMDGRVEHDPPREMDEQDAKLVRKYGNEDDS